MAAANIEDVSQVPLEVFEIHLHREEYFPGEILTGKLLIMTNKKMLTDGIFIKFESKVRVKWKKQQARLCGLQEAEFVEKEKTYFSNIFRYDLSLLPEGSSAFPFEFELPTELPPSVNHIKHLKMSYSVAALIRTQTEDYQQTKSFSVKGLLNLNAFPELSYPACKTLREAVHESCWAFGQLMKLSFSVNKQGFVPGEVINAQLTVDCCDYETAIKKAGVEVHLIQEVDLRAGECTRLRRRIISRNDLFSQSNTGENSKKYGFHLRIPEDSFISYEKLNDDLISIRYCIRMAMQKPAFPYKSIQILLPIKIGSIRIKERPRPIILQVPPQVCSTLHEKSDPNPDTDQRQDQKCSNSFQSPVPEILIDASEEVSSSKNPCKPLLLESSPNRRQSSFVMSNLTRGSSTVTDSSRSLIKPQDAFLEDSCAIEEIRE